MNIHIQSKSRFNSAINYPLFITGKTPGSDQSITFVFVLGSPPNFVEAGLKILSLYLTQRGLQAQLLFQSSLFSPILSLRKSNYPSQYIVFRFLTIFQAN